jgi:hypothetical protein
MKTTALIHLLALVATVAAGDRVTAQTNQTDAASLRSRIERRFDVLPLRDGVALRPHDSSRGVRSIEVANGLIAIDGQPVTGPDLRQKLAVDDANLVLQLSYLTDDQRRAMFGAEPAAPATAPPPPPEPREPRRSERRNRSRRDGDRVQFGSNITIGEDEVVDGDVVAIGGNVTVDGEVRGDVVAVGGVVALGPKAQIANNVVVVGGPLRRDPASRIGGRVQEVGIGSIDFGNLRWRPDGFLRYWGSPFGSVFALLGMLTRLAIECLLAALVLLFGRVYVERAGDQAMSDPLKSGAIGFLAQLLFVPVLVITIVVLFVTIIGIPFILLIPFLFLGLAIIGLVGFTGVAHRVGTLINSRLGWSNDNPYVTTTVGIVVVLLPALLARILGLIGFVMVPVTFGLGLIGILIEYLAWTVGFGAVALARFNRQPAPPATAV